MLTIWAFVNSLSSIFKDGAKVLTVTTPDGDIQEISSMKVLGKVLGGRGGWEAVRVRETSVPTQSLMVQNKL